MSDCCPRHADDPQPFMPELGDGKHDYLGNPLDGTDIAHGLLALSDGYVTAEREKELAAKAAEYDPVIQRWLTTIRPDLPAPIITSPEWQKAEREAKNAGKGSYAVEAARERILQAWLWDSLEYLKKHLPPPVRDKLERFIEDPTWNSRQDLFESVTKPLRGKRDSESDRQRAHVWAVMVHGHMPHVDTYASAVVHAAQVARMSSDERDQFWRHVDPAGLLERLSNAKPAESAIQKLIREHNAAR